MALYVLAFTDTDLGTWKSAKRTVRTVMVGGVYAVCERRAEIPELTDDALREQHALVVEIARRSRATLPTRFGTLIDESALLDWAVGHATELRPALDDVRDRVQMTVRILGRPEATPRTARAVTSGRAYLESRREALIPRLPEAAQELLGVLRPLVVRERIEAGQGGLLATVYQLIAKRDVATYRRAAEAAPPGVLVSGPWPPFAFTPQLF